MQNITIKYGYDSDTNQYIAEVPELNISDYGDTIDEAYKNLQKGLALYFEEISKPVENKQKTYA